MGEFWERNVIEPGTLPTLLVTGAFTAISAQTEPWVAAAAVMIGVGTSLVLDEFALILHLEDVYWTAEGRVSVELVGLAAACLDFVTVGLVPLGVTVGLCILKGKYRAALIGAFVPFTAWVSAVRLARPGSWWARRWYRTRGLERSRARDRAFQRRWDPRWDALSNFIAGRPTPIPAVIVPAATPPVDDVAVSRER
ncbi:MAG: hypothetical protein ABJA16_11165 [Nakamurella sp.]